MTAVTLHDFGFIFDFPLILRAVLLSLLLVGTYPSNET